METSDDSRPVTHADLARMTDQITDQITTAVDGRLAKNESLIKALMEARDPSNDAEISRLNRKVAELEMMLAAPEGTRDVHPTVEGSLPGSPTVAASSEVSVGDSAYRSNRNTPQRSSRGTSMASDAPEDGQAAATPYIHVDAVGRSVSSLLTHS
ncbi:hypothetical protein BDV95DRAFT_129435 [Massariosphaeria phaeospora]|uniref:Uncharacterized protein n=1 Tax=Massariosphaeria phaeospora TaxID=100035 RepID=A0A7C8M2W1_9PLEO|nr:hypothetical protein BDV95DRAFT_129435 [Massariosphaeria phaeospora]